MKELPMIITVETMSKMTEAISLFALRLQGEVKEAGGVLTVDAAVVAAATFLKVDDLIPGGLIVVQTEQQRLEKLAQLRREV